MMPACLGVHTDMCCIFCCSFWSIKHWICQMCQGIVWGLMAAGSTVLGRLMGQKHPSHATHQVPHVPASHQGLLNSEHPV